jgi:hypothetical protein
MLITGVCPVSRYLDAKNKVWKVKAVKRTHVDTLAAKTLLT